MPSPLPLTNSQIERLGIRLVSASAPSEDDLRLLRSLLAAYRPILSAARTRVEQATGHGANDRIKNTETVLEKLRREGGSKLKGMQDLAGMRIVGGFDRRGQNALAEDLSSLFAAEPRRPRVIDRRAYPSHGYRAVHVIVFPDGVAVEIQIRTELQHEWAEAVEKAAEFVGRGIRYGEDTGPPSPEHRRAISQSDHAGVLWATFRDSVVDWARAGSDVIDAFERLEESDPDAVQLALLRAKIHEGVEELLNGLARVKSKYD